MGAWGGGSFENDDALDWLGDLGDGGSPGDILDALELAAAIDLETYLEAPDASRALAAAELIAAARGFPAASLPPAARTWLADEEAIFDGDAAARARAAVIRVRDRSELRDLRDDAAPADARAWLAAVADLEARLRRRRGEA